MSQDGGEMFSTHIVMRNTLGLGHRELKAKFNRFHEELARLRHFFRSGTLIEYVSKNIEQNGYILS